MAAGAGNTYLDRSRKTYGLAYSTASQVNAYGALPANTAGYPNANTLSVRLRTAAYLLKSLPGTRIITIHWGGFDTHTNQITSQDIAVQGALARARRLPEGPPEPRHRPSRLAAGVLGVRAPREGDPEHAR